MFLFFTALFLTFFFVLLAALVTHGFTPQDIVSQIPQKCLRKLPPQHFNHRNNHIPKKMKRKGCHQEYFQKPWTKERGTARTGERVPVTHLYDFSG
jgi:hypothetical protein